MRGTDVKQIRMFSYVSLEELVPLDHPLRTIRQICDEALKELAGLFSSLYSPLGRSSVPPEQLLRALLVQALYSIRSERMLMEQLQYSCLFRWFVGLEIDEKVWVPTVFSKNRERLLEGDVAQAFFHAVLAQAREKDLLSDEHFSVDGTLLEAWASMKSFRKKEEPPEQGSGSGGKMLLRDTHECTTDPDAKLYRKSAGGAFQLCHMAHVLMENRNGLPVAGRVTDAVTDAEWDTAIEMLGDETRVTRRTVGADAGYDRQRFVDATRAIGVTPHIAQVTKSPSHIDRRTTRHAGYRISLEKRKGIEPIFGWLKNVGMLRKVRHRGRALVQWTFTLALSAYTMVRMRTISLQTAQVRG
jgi:transposase